MGIGTLVRYLIGSREAIHTIASTRHALWIGLLFVISAGFAREYDGEDLLHEPWHLVLPVAASLASSFVLFTFVYWVSTRADESWRDYPRRYLCFLPLFWMTAPLAWLYAIPYERFLEPLDAVAANLWTLGIVSAWRVALMVRVVQVLFRFTAVQSFFLVMLFADAVAILVLSSIPGVVLDVMGGLRTSANERERLVHHVAGIVGCFGQFTLVWVWIPGIYVTVNGSTPKWMLDSDSVALPNRSIVIAAVASVLIWLPLLPLTQPEQQRRGRVERLLKRGRIAEALEEMSAHQLDDYPPGWSPPPNFMHRPEDTDLMLQILRNLASTPAADWVNQTYLTKTLELIGGAAPVDKADREQIGRFLDRIPGGEEIKEQLREGIPKNEGS